MRGCAGEVKPNLLTMFPNGLLYVNMLVLADQQRLPYISSVPTLDETLRTFREQWTTGMDGGRESRKFNR